MPFVPSPAPEEPPLTAEEAEVRENPLTPLRENVTLGLLGGLAGLLLAVALWATAASLTGYRLGWLAVVLGGMVGLAVQKAGRGHGLIFGFIAAVATVAGCVLGNLAATVLLLTSQTEPLSPWEAFSVLDWETGRDLLVSVATPMDFLFLALAVALAWRWAFVRKQN